MEHSHFESQQLSWHEVETSHLSVLSSEISQSKEKSLTCYTRKRKERERRVMKGEMSIVSEKDYLSYSKVIKGDISSKLQGMAKSKSE